MFQLVMSMIHDESASEKWDSDSVVSNIEDGIVACQAFTRYIERLSRDYGIDFVLSPDDNEARVLGAWAELDGMHGRASIYVELQRPQPHDDVDRILDLMRIKARYTHLQHPAD